MNLNPKSLPYRQAGEILNPKQTQNPKPQFLKLKIFLSFFLFVLFFIETAFCGVSEEFKEKARMLKWIAYAPTNFDPTVGIYPNENSMREDLELLYQYGFNGVVTYGSERTLADIPRIASEVGFQGIIMGVWDIINEEEIKSAILASPYVDGYCVGNEGLHSRYDPEALNQAISDIKEFTKKPATTTEQVFDYGNDQVYNIGDWIFPNVHPFLAQVKDPQRAAMWVEKHYERLEKRCPPDRIVMIKETGFPTAGMPDASEINQRAFFLALEEKKVSFVYFEAYDQVWKRHLECEPYWGLFNYKRKPKKYISSVSSDHLASK